MNWLFKGVEIKELPTEVIGFVYCIYYTDGTKYIGSKLARSESMLPALKSGDVRDFSKRINRVIRRDEKGNILSGKKAKGIKGKIEPWDVLVTENNWINYTGSSKLSEGKTIQSKVITHLATNKRSMTYIEVRELMIVDACVNPLYVNENINGKWFDNALDGVYDYNPKEACLFKGDYDG